MEQAERKPILKKTVTGMSIAPDVLSALTDMAYEKRISRSQLVQEILMSALDEAMPQWREVYS